MTFDFQSYLASIRTTYAKWWEYYTLTDATGKQRQAREDSPFFDFGLMVQTVKREERDRPTEEKVERFSVLDGLRKYADQQVLLVGRPGSGKSTALARLMLEEATDQQARIPVLVELRYWQGSIEQLIYDSLIRHEMPAEQIEAALKHALILFDGVNELPSEEARSQLSAFRRNHPKLPMIFTTRDLSIGGDLGIEKKLEMQPLSEDQMREFVRAYVPEQAEQMLQQLKDRLRELGQTPLLLWMLCSLFRRTGKIPENLGLVFREFTQGYERYLKEDVRIESDKAWWKPVLQHLAWVMMQGEKPTEFRVAIEFEEAVGAIAQFLDGKVPYAEDFARKCLRDLQKHHLIQVGTNQEELEFRHQLIQEYYVAECLLKQLPILSDDEIQQNYLNYLNKTELVALMLALVEDEALAIRVVRLALEVDRVLGARLAGEVKLEFQKETVGFVNVLEVPNWLKVRVLQETRSEAAIPGLLRLLEDADSFVRGRAAYALGEIGTEAAIPGLLRLLEHADSFVRERAAYALGEIGTEAAIPGLLRLLEHADSFVRERAAYALGEIGTEAAIPGLLRLLEDADSGVRGSAAYALGKIAKKHAETISQHLPHLLTLIPTASGDDALRVILAIQENCKYYNYEIYQAYLEAQKHDLQTQQKRDRSNMNSINQSSLTLFYSYAHADETLRDELDKHLKLLQRQGIITAWHDRDITAGTEWATEIDQNLNTADIILLLISANFLASDYCYDTELTRALDRHTKGEARIIPIILKPCDWESAPFGKLQALPIAHGAGAKAVTTWNNQDEAFLAISKGIRKAAEEIRQKKTSS